MRRAHPFCRRSLPRRFVPRVLSPSQPEPSALCFFHFPVLLQFLQHARQIASPAVLQTHAVRDVPDAGRLGKCRKMREEQLRSDIVRDGRFSWFVGMALAGCHTVPHRLTDLRARSKTCFPFSARFFSCNAFQGSVSSSRFRSSTTILPSASRSSAGAYWPTSSRRHQFPVSRFVRMSVNQY